MHVVAEYMSAILYMWFMFFLHVSLNCKCVHDFLCIIVVAMLYVELMRRLALMSNRLS